MSGAADREIEEQLRSVLAATAPRPTRDETERLVARLAPYLPAPASVRAAIRHRRGSVRGQLEYLLRIGVSQATMLHAGFWLGSAVVLLIGVLVAASLGSDRRALVFYLVGPLLAYLGTSIGFRGDSMGLLEFEFACPVSPRQLTIARLIVIVGYQLITGLVLSGPLAVTSGQPLTQITWLWLAPLLLGTGLTLVLSLRMPLAIAAAAVYLAWVALVLAAWRLGSTQLAAVTSLELPIAVIGVGCVLATIVALPAALPRKLQRQPQRAG